VNITGAQLGEFSPVQLNPPDYKGANCGEVASRCRRSSRLQLNTLHAWREYGMLRKKVHRGGPAADGHP
jgi:hypothetical protein